MTPKMNNNLIEIEFEDTGKKLYFTSSHRAGQYIGKQKATIDGLLIKENKRLEKTPFGPITVCIVDGSEIPYKLINNTSGLELNRNNNYK